MVDKMQELFGLLDDDSDGHISSQKIDITGLSNDIIDILAPVLLQIEEHSLILNFDQFFEMGQRLLKDLNIQERNTLVGPKRQFLKSYKEECTFKPEIKSEKSHKLAEKIHGNRKEDFIQYMINEGKSWK